MKEFVESLDADVRAGINRHLEKGHDVLLRPVSADTVKVLAERVTSLGKVTVAKEEQ